MLLGAGALSSQAAIYLVGDFTGWSQKSEYEMTDADGDGIYTLKTTDVKGSALSVGFKVCNSEVSDNFGFFGNPDSELSFRSTQEASLVSGGNNFHFMDELNDLSNFEFYYDSDKSKLTVIAPDYPMYLRGGFDGWGCTEKMTYEGNGVYSFDVYGQADGMVYVEGADNGFKIGDANWGIYYAFNSDKIDGRKVSVNGTTTLDQYGNNNAYFEKDVLFVNMKFNAVSKELTIAPMTDASKVKFPDLYLANDADGDNNWFSEKDKFKFTWNSSLKAFELTFDEPWSYTGEMKVAAEGWPRTFNFGATYKSYTEISDAFDIRRLVTNSSYGNFTYSGEMTHLYFVPYFQNGTLNGNIIYNLPEEVYIVGLGDWNPENPQKVLKPVEGQLGLYRIEGVEVTSGNQDFRIFDFKTGWDQGGDWGFGEADQANAVDQSIWYTSVTLTKGWKGKVELEEGGYNIDFNVLTGELVVKNLDPSSVNKVTDDSVKVVAANGVISAEGALIDVYTVSGACVARQAEKVNAANGLYIVVANGKAQKVVLK